MNARTGRVSSNSILIRISLVATCGAACWFAPAASSQAQTNSTQQQSSPSPPAQQSSSGSPPQSTSAPAPQQSTAQGTSSAPAQQATPEVNTQESPVPFRVRVNLVPIRVIVHDAKGEPVKGLQREDFKIFQDGKPQVLSTFTVETPNAQAERAAEDARAEDAKAGTEAGSEKPASIQVPTRFVALLFDDVNADIGDFMRARNAAVNFVDHSLLPDDRAALFTFSGQWQQDFTDDRAKLKGALLNARPTVVTGLSPNGSEDCPPMDYYEADQIQNKNDQTALVVATQDTLACNPAAAQMPGGAAPIVQTEVLRVLEAGNVQTQYAFQGLQGVVRRITAMPGRRIIVLVSPGFIYPTYESELWKIIDQATRSNVYVNTLDARGLYTPTVGPDIAQRQVQGDPRVAGQKNMMELAAQSAEADVLNTLAWGTGGFFFHNNNDFDEGFRSLAKAPEVSYLLGYTPEGLKMDGRFHSLKVTIARKGPFTVQARKGFLAPKHNETPEEAAKQEIEDALFSQEVQTGIPVSLHTQYYMADQASAKLSIEAHVDVAHMRFDKADGRNKNDLTVVAGLFDRNGNFLNGHEKTVQFRLRDATLERLNRTGLTVTTDFDVKPGAYVVRLVVRDADMLSTQNGVVEIP